MYSTVARSVHVTLTLANSQHCTAATEKVQDNNVCIANNYINHTSRFLKPSVVY